MKELLKIFNSTIQMSVLVQRQLNIRPKESHDSCNMSSPLLTSPTSFLHGSIFNNPYHDLSRTRVYESDFSMLREEQQSIKVLYLEDTKEVARAYDRIMEGIITYLASSATTVVAFTGVSTAGAATHD